MSKKAPRKALLQEIRTYYRGHARATLPWRRTRDPYRILVSEVMLQQTQVDRVIPFYERFIKKFPNARVLARTPLRNVLKAWQGLGYNRRAKHLRDAAKIIAKKKFPKSTAEIEQLPGVGHYTARAVAAFAYNKPEVFIETNIRTVFLHHFFQKKNKVSDAAILPLVAQTLKESRMQPREFYWALMDYGSYLKSQGIRLNSQSKHYAKQSKFEGSARQLRGAILREIIAHHATLAFLLHRIPRSREEMIRELSRLTAEGLIKLHGRFFEISK
ncbi:MAG: A/G-specific adenine glycosylase [Patescibacteria group bacterium]